MSSLRRWLMSALIGVIAVIGALGSAFSYREGLVEADELFDAKLAHSARVLVGIVEPALRGTPENVGTPIEIDVWQGTASGQGDDLVSADGHAYETKLAFQIWSSNGRLLLRSRSGPATALAPLERGFGEATIGGEHWRTFALESARGDWFMTGESYAIRGEIARDIAFGTMLPMLISVPVTALLVWFIVGVGLRPLRQIALQVERLDPQRLAPVSSLAVPTEVLPLVNAINRLVTRLTGTLARERRFTADAAHELRTPLGALKVHVGNLVGTTSEVQRAESMARVQDGIVRMERLFTQLLLLGRAEAGAAAARMIEFDLVACVRDEIAVLAPQAVDREVELSLHACASAVQVHGNAIAVGVLVRNLLENAIRHAPVQGSVQVEIDVLDDATVEVRVSDSGDGIEENAHERVFERFHREQPGDDSGSGLGLSIVRVIADLHGATIRLERAELGGLCVVVHFPRGA